MVAGAGESGTNAGCGGGGHAMRGGREDSMVRNDAVVTLGGVIGAKTKGCAGESGQFDLLGKKESGVDRGTSRTSTEGAIIDGLMTFGLNNHPSGPYAVQGGKVSFVEMDHTKAMNSTIAFFLGDHGSDNLLPGAKGVAGAGTIIDETKM